jgi:hypothetical protein
VWTKNGSGSSIFYSKPIKKDTDWWAEVSNLVVRFMEGVDLPVVRISKKEI